jgi:hypothetical protein
MRTALSILVLILSVSLGVVSASSKVRGLVLAVCFVILFLFANFVQCMPYFISDPYTWINTYGSGLTYGFFIPLFITALPALIAYGIARTVVWFLKPKSKSV